MNAAATTANIWMEMEREMHISPQGSRLSQCLHSKSVPMPHMLERPIVR